MFIVMVKGPWAAKELGFLNEGNQNSLKDFHQEIKMIIYLKKIIIANIGKQIKMDKAGFRETNQEIVIVSQEVWGMNK